VLPNHFDGVILVIVGNSVGVLSLDIANGVIAARSKVGVETYKRLRATVSVVDTDAHAQMTVVFGSLIYSKTAITSSM